MWSFFLFGREKGGGFVSGLEDVGGNSCGLGRELEDSRMHWEQRCKVLVLWGSWWRTKAAFLSIYLGCCEGQPLRRSLSFETPLYSNHSEVPIQTLGD